MRHRSGPDLIPASLDLVAAELELAAEMGRERVLADALSPVATRYDFATTFGRCKKLASRWS